MCTGHVIGIIGGVGTGKSTVLGILRDKYGAEIIEADAVGHDLMKRGEILYREELAFFGVEILDASGEIDRKKLGEIVFSDKDKLKVLNDMAHPAIREEIARRLEAWRKDAARQNEKPQMDSDAKQRKSAGEGQSEKTDSEQEVQSTVGEAGAEQEALQLSEKGSVCKGFHLAVLEAALPEEAGMPDFCERLWAVTVPLEVRIKRLMDGRGYSREKCIGIISSQRSDEEFEAMADAVIDNGGSVEDTERQLDALVKELENINQTR